jgi:predicted transposase YdaD
VETPPYIIECADKRSIVFDYDVIRLWEVESEWILKRRIIPLYILLPGTKSPKVDLLKQALHEMAQVYDRPQLAYRFVWFYQILRRTDTMSEEDKQVIEKELGMQFNYRELVQDDPVIQELFAEGKAEGRAEGKIEGLQEAALNVLHMRFPALATTPQVQQAIASIQDAKELTVLHRALFLASDEQEARKLLKLPVQGDLL